MRTKKAAVGFLIILSLLLLAAAPGLTQPTGTMADLGTLGGDESYALDVNNRGQVVGWAYTAGGLPFAFLWEKGVMTNLGTLGGSYSYGWGINDPGQVVGQSPATGDYPAHAVMWDPH